MDTPNLASVRVWERTAGVAPTPFVFGAASTQVTTRLTTLNAGSRDFFGTPNESYDLYYSNADASPNANGFCITVDAVYFDNFGGGHNIAAVDLVFDDGSVLRADVLKTFTAGGADSLPETAVNAIDGDLQTHTTLGTSGGKIDRLSVTVGFSSITAPCPGDANGDNLVNFSDLNAVLAAFGQSGDGLIGDVNGDGVVNFSDLNEVLANFGEDCTE
jgi:hypothetical protein